ncbi:hypothetical protein [Burkholderia sp. MSMB1826]|uniref:hypothetical protein n=1 Tax=Burkholderia sp. MSMB1826 TaxID=1637875 RepID=UPI003F88CEFE
MFNIVRRENSLGRVAILFLLPANEIWKHILLLRKKLLLTGDKGCAARGLHAVQGDRATFNRILIRSLSDREYAFAFRAADHMTNTSRRQATEIHAGEAIEHDTAVISQVTLANDGLHFVNSMSLKGPVKSPLIHLPEVRGISVHTFGTNHGNFPRGAVASSDDRLNNRYRYYIQQHSRHYCLGLFPSAIA